MNCSVRTEDAHYSHYPIDRVKVDCAGNKAQTIKLPSSQPLRMVGV